MKSLNCLFRVLSALLLSVALAGFAALWWHDAWYGFQYDAAHLRAGSPPFIFIGLAFIAFQLSQPIPRRQQIKGLLLGTAFALWGTEPFVQPGLGLTILDDGVIGVFVFDLGMIICGKYWAGK